jgi:hypothetical protein
MWLMAITTSENDIKERLSIAFVSAVAAHAGCQIVQWHIDKLSIDGTIRAVSGSRACVDVQLKATSQNIIDGDKVFFDLPIKNYDDLREEAQTHPHYLVVLHLPGRLKSWLKLSTTQLAIRGVAYWGNLVGLEASANQAARRVRMPTSQRFTPESLRDMINRAPHRIGGPGIQ